MKTVFAALFVITLTTQINAQDTPRVAYYDALYLKQLYSKNKDKLLITPITQKILAYYFGKDSTGLNAVVLDNPFLKQFFINLNDKLSNRVDYEDSNINAKSLSYPSGLLSSIGGLDVTNIADGLAKFLVKRTKQELTIAFFSKFDSLIAKYPDLQTVFPQTYQALSIIGDEIYNYKGYIQTLRESFEKDLQNLNTSLPSIIPYHQAFFSAHKELAATLRSGCYIAGSLRDKVHPGDILANYPADYLDSLNPNWKGAIQTLQLISASLRDKASNDDNTDSVNYWVTTKQIRQLVTDTIAFKIYLGLIYQQALTFNKDASGNPDSIMFVTNISNSINPISLNSVLRFVASQYSRYTQLSTFITNFGAKANKLNTLIKQYQKQTTDSLLIQQYYNYATATVDLLKQAATITDVPAVKSILKINLADTLKNYFDVAQSSTNLVLNISKRNYSAAIVNVTHIYDVTIAKQAKQDADKYSVNNNQASKALKKLKKNIKQAVKQSSDISSLQAIDLKEMADTSLSANLHSVLMNADTLAALVDTKTVQNSMFKYGSFMAAMVQAKSSDDVENTIEAFALPAGSSRIKRETKFNVALNAYTGLYAGYEKIKGYDPDHCWQFNSIGVTAPIGVSVSWGQKKFLWVGNEKKKHWSYSAFISLIDIGAVAAFRFQNDSTVIAANHDTTKTMASQSPVIQLKHLVSPGVFLSVGIPKCPLSLNLGVQVGPNLRNVSSSNNSVQLDFSNNVYVRYSASLCVDIPLLNFYTKSQ